MFKCPAVAKTLSTFHSKYDMFRRSITASFLSTQKHYVDCFKTELGWDLSQGHHTVEQLHYTKYIIDNQRSVLSSVGLSIKMSNMIVLIVLEV